MTRIELVTPSLPRKYSTPELHRHLYIKRQKVKVIYFTLQSHKMSGRRDSNPRPLAWKANALSTELLPHSLSLQKCRAKYNISQNSCKNIPSSPLKLPDLICFQGFLED